ncbi:MAG: aminoacyl-histidine dipeptidase [Clostridia bacterium]|nr:aminoacyl-histidine dipeptidase [Clostridia bacterium]
MDKLKGLEPRKVFEFFEEISGIPRGSGNMKKIADYCVSFAEKRGLKYLRDEADNVVIFKDATKGYENADDVILQGHLDMVCQKTEEKEIDFLSDGLDLFVDGDFVKAKGTTLGADNGIAVAMVLAILDSEEIPHPALEAVFTTDEEIGMIGALKLDMSYLKGKKMINLDAEEDGILTVSCAGGSDFLITVPVERKKVTGDFVKITLKGLKGGHSGVEINDGRVNADVLAGRFLNHMKNCVNFDLISVDGGDKGNAIPNVCKLSVLTKNKNSFVNEAEKYLDIIKKELSEREPSFEYLINIGEEKTASVLTEETKNKIIFALVSAPNGVVEMSKEIEGLVETSLNLGILKTEEEKITLHFTLRSNKKSALIFLEEKLGAFSDYLGFESESFGHYPPWEYKGNSSLQQIYKECFTEQNGYEPCLEAIHAGLECGVFASAIENLDCVALGPALWDVHTVNEKLSVSSTERTFKLVVKILEKCI